MAKRESGAQPGEWVKPTLPPPLPTPVMAPAPEDAGPKNLRLGAGSLGGQNPPPPSTTPPAPPTPPLAAAPKTNVLPLDESAELPMTPVNSLRARITARRASERQKSLLGATSVGEGNAPQPAGAEVDPPAARPPERKAPPSATLFGLTLLAPGLEGLNSERMERLAHTMQVFLEGEVQPNLNARVRATSARQARPAAPSRLQAPIPGARMVPRQPTPPAGPAPAPQAPASPAAATPKSLPLPPPKRSKKKTDGASPGGLGHKRSGCSWRTSAPFRTLRFLTRPTAQTEAPPLSTGL